MFKIDHFLDLFAGYATIMRYLRVIKTDLKDISSVQHEMKSMLETSKGIIKTNVKGFTEEYNLDLPFKEMTDFRLFDMRLGTDSKFRQDFVSLLKASSLQFLLQFQDVEISKFVHQMSSLYFLLDRENVLTKSVTNILRKFMSRDVALKFTAVKQSVGKLILKETYFAECLKGK